MISLNFPCKILILFSILIVVINGNLINTDENRFVRRQLVQSNLASPIFDESDLRKNDDAHLRLYYKSHSPNRIISHELEHRYMQKNPNIAVPVNQYNRVDFSPYRSASQYEYKPIDYNYPLYSDNSNNKETVLLHYQGNAIDDLNPLYQSGYAYKSQPLLQSLNNSPKNRLFKILMMNTNDKPNSIQSIAGYNVPQYEINNINNQLNREKSINLNANNNNNGMQYKIVHLKFKLEPQNGKVSGQGFVEADNLNNTPSSKKLPLIPQDIPDLVNRLLQTTQQQAVNPLLANIQKSYLNRREDLSEEQNTSYVRKRSIDETEDNTISENKWDKRNDNSEEETNQTNESDTKDLNRRNEQMFSDELTDENEDRLSDRYGRGDNDFDDEEAEDEFDFD